MGALASRVVYSGQQKLQSHATSGMSKQQGVLKPVDAVNLCSMLRAGVAGSYMCAEPMQMHESISNGVHGCNPKDVVQDQLGCTERCSLCFGHLKHDNMLEKKHQKNNEKIWLPHGSG